jgi:F0F1-type ATP synthase assembly protein I
LAINALSRVIAVLVLGAAIAGLGALLDNWLGTNYWMLVGIVLGTMLAIPGLFLVARVSELDSKRLAKDSQVQGQDSH